MAGPDLGHPHRTPGAPCVADSAPVQIPLERFGEHEALAQAGHGHVQRKHAAVEQPYQVVLLAHDARDHVRLGQVAHDAQPRRLLRLPPASDTAEQ